MTDESPDTTGGRVAETLSSNAAEIAERTVGMGAFVGLLIALVALLLVREAGLVAFSIPDGLLATIGLVALLIASVMDTSIVPE